MIVWAAMLGGVAIGLVFRMHALLAAAIAIVAMSIIVSVVAGGSVAELIWGILKLLLAVQSGYVMGLFLSRWCKGPK